MEQQQHGEAALPQIFNFNNTKAIRCLLVDNEPWFVAKDVCEVLGLNNVGQALTRLDEACIISSDVWSATNSRAYSLKAVNESGLYDLVFDSRKPEAKAFRRWVTQTVLPSIRRTGGYGVQQPGKPLPRLAVPMPNALRYVPSEHFATLAALSKEEAGSWITLVTHAWDSGPLPTELAVRLVGEAHFERLRYLLLPCGSAWSFGWIERERERVNLRSQQNSLNGMLGGRGKKGDLRALRAKPGEQLTLRLLLALREVPIEDLQNEDRS